MLPPCKLTVSDLIHSGERLDAREKLLVDGDLDQQGPNLFSDLLGTDVQQVKEQIEIFGLVRQDRVD